MSRYALVPSTDARAGFSLNCCTPPAWSVHFSSTSLPVLKPRPTRRTVWPALAEAWPASAGVPDSATDSTPLSADVNATLTPPAVFTLTAPKAPALSGTVRRTHWPLAHTSAPVLLLRSVTTISPKRYSPAPSVKPRPYSTTTALLPSAATLSTCTSLSTGTICSGTLAALPATRTTPLTAWVGT